MSLLTRGGPGRHDPLALAWLVGAGAALWALLSRGERGVGLPTGVRVFVVVAGWLWFETLSAPGMDTTLPAWDRTWWEGSLGCVLHGMFYALATAPVLWWAARRSAPAAPEAAGAVAGLAAAYTGVVVLQLKCASVEMFHVLGAHAMVLLLGTLLGTLSARRWLVP